MRYFFLFFLGSLFLYAEEYPAQFEGKFEGWDEKRVDLMALFLPANPTILIAGAYYGNEALNYAKAWPEAKIIAFEPNPHAFDILRYNLSDIKGAQCYPEALNNLSGTATLYVCHGTEGDNPAFEHATSLLKPSPSMEIHYQGPRIPIECVVLDFWCREKKIDHIDLLRLDVQGSELQVLSSCPQILGTVKVLYIATNFFPFRIGTTYFENLRSFLELSGFQLLSHWYREGLQGDAIFIKRGIEETEFDETLYEECYIEPLDAAFFVEPEIPDGIKAFLREGIYWEGTIGNLIKQYVKEGTIAIDIGAHIGLHTVVMSRKVGPQGAVIAFEPQKKIYAEQLQNLKINDCNNVISLRKAVGEGFKTIEMNPRDPTNEGGTSVGEGGDVAEMIPLDSLNLKNVSLIKVDVETYEYYIFLGARETILRNRPVIMFEIMGNYDYETGSPEIKEKFERVIALIESMNYKVYQIFGNDYIAFPLESLTFY